MSYLKVCVLRSSSSGNCTAIWTAESGILIDCAGLRSNTHLPRKNDPGQRNTMKIYADQATTRDYLPEYLDINDEFKSAFDLMEYTKKCLFIAGKAGTGKLTLLKYFKANAGKKIIVLAPAGVASINEQKFF